MHYQNRHPWFLRLVLIILLVPIRSAECERMFSLINRLKADLRRRIKNGKLNGIMTVHRRLCSSDTTYLCTTRRHGSGEFPSAFELLLPASAVLLQLCARPAGAIRPCRKTCTYASRHNTPLPRYAPVFSSRISVASRRQKHKMRRRLRRRRRRRRLRSLREHTTRCLTFGPHGTGTQSGLGWAAAGAA